jgi:hypothetical protein
MGTHLILKDRLCDSGIISFSFYAKHNGIVGLLFRYRSNNSYYILEISNTFVRLRRKMAPTKMELIE